MNSPTEDRAIARWSMKKVVQKFLHHLHTYWKAIRTPSTEEDERDRQGYQ